MLNHIDIYTSAVVLILLFSKNSKNNPLFSSSFLFIRPKYSTLVDVFPVVKTQTECVGAAN